MTQWVYVQDQSGAPLMPTKRHGKVRHWLESGRAEIVQHTPFTIRLLDVAGGFVQPLTAGIDFGTAHVGVSVRSASAELLSAEITLRTDISGLLTDRRMYRCNRRARRTPYREPRFLNRVRADELMPSVRAKVDETLKMLTWVSGLLPIHEWVFELGNFDTHKLVNPEVEGEDYQQGVQEGFANVREYVLWRDKHTCQHCRGASDDPLLTVHHIHHRSDGGSDRPENLITLCQTCHHAHHNDYPLKLKPPLNFSAPAQFNVLRAYLLHSTVELQPTLTYGYLTKVHRQALKLPKSHRNDAFVISGGQSQTRAEIYYQDVFVRRQNRKLFKGARSHIRNTLPSVGGFRRGDKVRLATGQIGFIHGLRTIGYFDVRQLDGTVLHHSAKMLTLTKLESARTFRIQSFVTNESSRAQETPVFKWGLLR